MKPKIFLVLLFIGHIFIFPQSAFSLGAFVGKFGSYGSDDGQFDGPIGITVDDNYIYVTDEFNNRVQIFNKTYPYLFAAKLENGNIQFPDTIAVDNNYIYVGTNYCAMQIFSKNLLDYPLLACFALGGSGDGEFSGFIWLAVDNNYIFMTDTDNNRVQIFNKTTPYSFVAKFGSRGSGDGQFSRPSSIAVDNNFIYVADTINHSVQIFGKTYPYSFVAKVGSVGTGDGQFYSPVAITVDSNYIYVADENNSRIQIFNKTSPYAFVAKFGSDGTEDGQFDTILGIAVDSNYIYAADYGNNRVQIFSLSLQNTCSTTIQPSPADVYPQKTGNDGNTTSTVTISLTGSVPPEGCAVNLSVEPVNISGGHVHYGDRPKGTITDSNGNLVASIPFAYNGATNANVTYKSAEVAGQEKIKAAVNGQAVGEATITVKVPELEPMPLGGQGYYRLTGFTGTHPDNHYGTPSTKIRILATAAGYYKRYEESIGVNDMSLALGGLLDINGTWSPPHSSHRKGTSVDIDRCAQTLVEQDDLDDIATGYSGTRIVENALTPPSCEGPADTPLIHYDFP